MERRLSILFGIKFYVGFVIYCEDNFYIKESKS